MSASQELLVVHCSPCENVEMSRSKNVESRYRPLQQPFVSILASLPISVRNQTVSAPATSVGIELFAYFHSSPNLAHSKRRQFSLSVLKERV